MERNSDHQTKKKTVRPMTSQMMSPMMSPMTSPMTSSRMSLDAIHAFDQMKLKDKRSSMKPNQSSPSYAAQHSHHHRHHHQQQHQQQQATTTSRRSSHAGLSEEQRPKSVSASPASAAAASRMRRMRFASDDQHPIIRPTAAATAAAAAAEKHRNGKKSPTAATGRNSILSKTASINHSFLLSKQQHEKQDGGGIRSREEQPNACRRTSMPMRDNRKHVSSASLPLAQHPNRSCSISSREANAMNRMRDGSLLLQMQQRLQQQEKPFRISPMGYDSRYEDIIFESQRCVDDDDIAPEGIAQAIDKCRLWLKKHHVDNYGGRRASYFH